MVNIPIIQNILRVNQQTVMPYQSFLAVRKPIRLDDEAGIVGFPQNRYFVIQATSIAPGDIIRMNHPDLLWIQNQQNQTLWHSKDYQNFVRINNSIYLDRGRPRTHNPEEKRRGRPRKIIKVSV